MRKSIIGSALLGILLLGFTIPGVALADKGEKGCSNLGTWFGVAGIGDTTLTGWMVTVTGKSNSEGTNNFEFSAFDPTLAIFGLGDKEPYKDAVGLTSMRGDWKRTGGNTFDYTFMGYAYNAMKMPVYISKVSGQVELIEDCQYQFTTAVMETFSPAVSPFDGPRLDRIDMGVFLGYRAKVILAD